MVALKNRNLKLFTVVLAVFAITIMSFLHYNQNSGLVLWNPGKYFRFSGPFIRFISSVRRSCSCETCVSEPESPLWFNERFNLSIPPLLTKQNSVVSESTYKWWMRLQDDKNPMDINKAIEEIFKVIPGDNSLLNHNPYRCRTCAIVGNSGNLKGSDYGQDIDAHDFVLRMNHAPTARFEKDVGNKTTHHFVYPESVRDLRDNVSMVLIPFKTLDLQWIVSALTTGSIDFTYAPVPRRIKVTKDKILVYHPDFMKYIYDKWLFRHGRYPSTGMLSVVFALHICDQVDLYGFGADSKGNWHHYWENNPSAGAFRQTGVHDGDFEAELIGNLTSINKIKVYKGR
ncbi:CMP-N-acetylneuraminate-beta-galactosamide-alpha-2,3-sialyltransferase 1 [Bufo bufo]|uniref:CMP-N-acetylneuraminate-beta-galactosamide- alpha-2,3-sialyltransferase 1 n=1 Tax=Bufo bufo TaxID=8384 RepID=UPI001ABDA332|nr:CMP-N-acetylneuraminate-beta-galactosamide-alpha-2,3-sialyltransferase 1 [Bufo bufo]XP_040288112.1 CMP-N-acetylneuraminate-beta-galactosamide-alpha-2,3-sialyltransferase 1 [Bufo bufo]XP_040288113.1 CMP-N-acetylneuraminate-beta-galactosamide-alpha-2,3-sialyltransferase 1 [Bufo bufo]XP_040288114.1 CMP-N-acetylneuraminate-beta-galactosamide-alpha-2,3-sialyltransferase 1 [Bufo bufo]XP_040288115.1 CMP-N-acetylneuraminate-beta-galactosamide-alpha-2,3-sialyltransferase 1 [Bufo bufo]XP_040288117.1 